MKHKRQATVDEQKLVLETYNNCESAIRYNIYKLLPFKDLTEDCIQETFIIAFDNIDKFVKSENREGWLYKASTYAVYRTINTEKKHSVNTVSLDKVDFAVLSMATEKISDEKGKKRIIGQIKKHLTKANGEFLELYLEKSRSTKELAEIIGCSDATVRSKMKRLVDEIKTLPPEIKEKILFL